MDNLTYIEFEDLYPSLKLVVWKAYRHAIDRGWIQEDDLDHIIFKPNEVINFVTKKEKVCE